MLQAFVQKQGHHNWQKLPFLAGLARFGKSCRLRWVNYLQPGLKKGKFSKEEVDLIIKLHDQIGNRWSAIAESLPGRTDNDIKNHWHAHIKKRGKRSHFVTRVEMGSEEESFEMNCCKKSNDEEETPGFNGQDSCAGYTDFEAYDNRFLSTEEEFNDLGSLHYDTPTSCFSYSSDGGGGITSGEFNIHDLPPEEELSTLGLRYNHTPCGPCTFSYSSDGGGITYDDHTCSSFNQLNTDYDSSISRGKLF